MVPLLKQKPTMKYCRETNLAFHGIPQNTVSKQAHKLGMEKREPLIVILDSLLAYAQAYRARFDNQLSNDYVLGPDWLKAITGVRGLLNGDGAVAMVENITTDSKDNGACESVFWAAMDVAGYTEDDI